MHLEMLSDLPYMNPFKISGVGANEEGGSSLGGVDVTSVIM